MNAPNRPPSGQGREAVEGKGPQRLSKRRLGRRLEGVAKAVGGSYGRLYIPLGQGDSGWAQAGRPGGGGGWGTFPPSHTSLG